MPTESSITETKGPWTEQPVSKLNVDLIYYDVQNAINVNSLNISLKTLNPFHTRLLFGVDGIVSQYEGGACKW